MPKKQIQMFTPNGEWTDYVEEQHLDIINKIMFYINEAGDELMLCGAKPVIRYHIDLVAKYKDKHSLDGYKLSGAATMNMRVIEMLSSKGYNFNTNKVNARKIITHLGEPFLGGYVESFMDDDSRNIY